MRKLAPAFALALALALAASALAGAAGAEAGDEIDVVVNKAHPARALAREELRPVFQTSRTQWPDGAKTEPFNLPDDSPTRHEFDAAVLGLDPDRVARYWVDRKIRGGAPPPRKLPSPAAVLRAVAADKGSVGYVPAKEVNDSVRIVAKIRHGQVFAP